MTSFHNDKYDIIYKWIGYHLKINVICKYNINISKKGEKLKIITAILDMIWRKDKKIEQKKIVEFIKKFIT